MRTGDRAVWATAFYAGLRRGELVALRWEDVDLATGLIRVQRGWDAVEGEVAPKGRRGKRKVPIPAIGSVAPVRRGAASPGCGPRRCA
jgi:integrase